MPNLPIALTMAAAATLLHIWHFYRCGKQRVRGKILIGDGGDVMMERLMRAHANFIENTPLFLILLALVEYNVGGSTWLWATGYIFIAARIAHAIGMDSGTSNIWRGAGMMFTLLPLLGLAGYALWLASGLST